MIDKDNYYYTSNVYVVAYLQTKNIEHIKTSKNNHNRVVFVFPKTQKLLNGIEEYKNTEYIKNAKEILNKIKEDKQ